jgi:hypothetical protein
MSTWDAARLAQRRPLPKPRKVHAPVVGAVPERFAPLVADPRFAADPHCTGCGYHACVRHKDVCKALSLAAIMARYPGYKPGMHTYMKPGSGLADAGEWTVWFSPQDLPEYVRLELARVKRVR